MSIWSDIGVIDSEMRGVKPCTFLNTAYGFFKNLRHKIWPDFDTMNLSDWSFERHRKASDIGLRGGVWPNLELALSFPHGEDFGYGRLLRPVTDEYWNTSPDFNAIFSQTEETLLGEEILQSPYGYGKRPAIMDPAWPVQRYKVIQHLRYITVPLNIRVEVADYYGTGWHWEDWYSYGGYNQYGCIDKPGGQWYYDYFEWGFIKSIEAKFSDYWTQGNSVFKIGVLGERHYSDIHAEIEGCFWINGKEYDYTYPSPTYYDQKLRIFGAVDLATHPDFKDYFDVNAG